MRKSEYPFLFGAQYYRAPTPGPECWDDDLAKMRRLGMNAIKYWVQWRWSHREPNEFHFDDLDRLMDLAAKNELSVTLNTILDVSPIWLYDVYPDARMINASGSSVEPYAVSHRQIGGHSGPCYSHPGALAERRKFMSAAIRHFKDHPAMGMWDVWNEPEQALSARAPSMQTLVCYCQACLMGFAAWLEQKYSTIDCLNDIWGRCYSTFSQIEAPLHSGAVNDFIDWREFHLDTMTEEARWRLQTVRQYDGLHPAYLHVVPNTMKPFNSITCVDDFALAPLCDVFAATMNDGPVFASQVVSAGRGRVCYNVESHLNFGGTGLHPRRVDHEDVRRDFLTQIGFGVRGFLMWQFRPESLGLESPAWGMIAGDGGDLPVTVALRDFWSKIGPLAGQFMSAMPVRARVGIWKSRRNECFHFAMHGSLDQLIESVEGYIRNLYWHNIPFRIVSENMLATGDLDDLAVLILPSPYHMTLDEACALDEWVRGGGVALCEAHLAGYNGTTGRHEWKMPGCGLADSWGMRESWTTSSHHLNLGQGDAFDQDVSEDVRKAMQEWQASGGRFFPMSLADGRMILGATRFAVIEGDGLAVDATFGDGSGEVMIATKPLGRGWIVYCGCHLGETAQKDERGLMTMVRRACDLANMDREPVIKGMADSGRVHIDWLLEGQNRRFFVAVSRSDRQERVTIDGSGGWRGIFTGQMVSLPGTIEIGSRSSEIFVESES